MCGERGGDGEDEWSMQTLGDMQSRGMRDLGSVRLDLNENEDP